MSTSGMTGVSIDHYRWSFAGMPEVILLIHWVLLQCNLEMPPWWHLIPFPLNLDSLSDPFGANAMWQKRHNMISEAESAETFSPLPPHSLRMLPPWMFPLEPSSHAGRGPCSMERPRGALWLTVPAEPSIPPAPAQALAMIKKLPDDAGCSSLR